ncbi:hypothetical protein LZZ85_21430 [Terrimonas sp. NA20]|uniref:Uncharacterized protein n=1 Tax=Terrimonas ginsenosidimutans TaxID=2908004 RepID=A0ABS9KX56_9BACT|nr:hypothetical protein [Terrimonas ginsenosidimutans]MCG2616873.1 hypothetical protein [Terrimonas ginsenosidimutans]
MNRKIQLIALLLFCGIVIAFAIRAGQQHENCRENCMTTKANSLALK